MARAAALLGLVLALSACQAPPPRELSGLWSAGPAACAAGVGLNFRADAIEAVYADDRETLFANPKYRVLPSSGGPLRVRIRYDLPTPPGGVKSGAHGILVLERRNDGWLTPISHQLEDARTGAVHMKIGEDPLDLALTVRPCAPNAWIAGLRGRDPS